LWRRKVSSAGEVFPTPYILTHQEVGGDVRLARVLLQALCDDVRIPVLDLGEVATDGEVAIVARLESAILVDEAAGSVRKNPRVICVDWRTMLSYTH
jgi:hypothetical protein